MNKSILKLVNNLTSFKKYNNKIYYERNINMRIGIDIDGVLEDVEQFQIEYGSKYFYEKYQKIIVNPNGYNIKNIFDVKQELDDEFWREHIREYAVKEKAREFASEVIEKLKQDDNEIYIITARTSDLTWIDLSEKEMEHIVKVWLNKNNIYYDKIIFSPEDKLDVCLENDIDLMIEDKVENISKISTKIPVICFDAKYNKECKGTNITRGYSWYDIYAKIQDL